MPSADFCRPLRIDYSTLSPESRTKRQISRGKFDRLPHATAGFTLRTFDGHGLRCPLPTRPLLTPPIRFLFIGSYVCSTLLSDPASRRRPCASLSLHLHQVVKRTFTFELSNMLGTQSKRRHECRRGRQECLRHSANQPGGLQGERLKLWKRAGGGNSGRPFDILYQCFLPFKLQTIGPMTFLTP
jgi:hypothetical protein